MRYVIIGSSAAGINGAREIRSIDKEASIILISRDEQIYSRCILHHYLGNQRTARELNFAEEDFDKKYQAEWKKGTKVTGLDVHKKAVFTDKQETIFYDKLLIATGSHTFMPPIPNLDQAVNVVGFRNLEDMDRIKELVKTRKNVVVMGAGLVGLDCTCGLLELSITPVIVEMGPRLLNRQLDKRAARTYEEALEKKKVKQYYNTAVKSVELNCDKEIEKIQLSTEETIPCDLLILTAGVRPNVDFLKGSPLKIDKQGLWYDELGQTSVEDIYGAGDVSGKAPIWPVAVKEGIIAGSNMAGVEKRMTDFFSSKATMNFQGIPTMSLGCVEPENSGYEIEIEDKEGTYKKIIHKNGKITGAILQGDLSYGGILQQLIACKIDVSKVKKSIFDVDYSDFFHVDENFEYYYEKTE